MELFQDTHIVKLELLSNATTITHYNISKTSNKNSSTQRNTCHWIQPLMTTAAIAK
ncbi:MAG: hypothetical protein ACJ71O_02245 [Nitrososphaeraceae archaeon]